MFAPLSGWGREGGYKEPELARLTDTPESHPSAEQSSEKKARASTEDLPQLRHKEGATARPALQSVHDPEAGAVPPRGFSRRARSPQGPPAQVLPWGEERSEH